MINNLFAQYQSTFLALCELINNSIQAGAKNIVLTIDYAKENEMLSPIIKKIELKDDGSGVHSSEIDAKIFGVGDSHKKGGKGIGRFGALQIGANFTIETVGIDSTNNHCSRVRIPLSENLFKNSQGINELVVDTNEEVLEGNHNTYYKVIIENIYDSDIIKKFPKRKISEKLLSNNIFNSIFERYPIPIFNKLVRFTINSEFLNPSDFVVKEPEKIHIPYKDKKGEEHSVLFTFINLKSHFDKIKVFLTTKNAGIDCIVGGFEFTADWLSPKIGSWFVYIYSDVINTDMYRNIDLDGMDESVTHFNTFIKDKLNHFFKDKNKEFDDFTTKLRSDQYYPYKEADSSSSNSKVVVFDKLAYLVEEKYNLINQNVRLREIIYPLIDRTISTGELDNILQKILRLDKKYVKQFNELLERSDLEDIIEFSEKVSRKIEDLEFLEKITYSEIAKHILERKELHKILEKMLWIFGEQYNDTTRLLSDRNLENNLIELREQILKYKPSKIDDNINELQDVKIKSITDLFLYNERILDEKKREVLVVELKAPKVKISQKELDQVTRYALEIEERPFFSDKVKFNIILISSEISRNAKIILKGNQKGKDNPYHFWENESGNISISVIRWSDLIENNKRKLKYMSSILKTKDISIQDKIEKDFSEIEFTKVKSTLRKVVMQD
jgi:hypothetical protein